MNKYIPWFLVIFLVLTSCASPQPQYEYEDLQMPAESYEPEVETPFPTHTPESLESPAVSATVVPIPDFAERIVLSGFGGGGINCQFEKPPAPSVTGGTMYRVTPPSPDMVDSDYGAKSYPRGAQICISGAPEDVPIAVRLTSPGQDLVLTTEVKAVPDPEDPDRVLNLLWTAYPNDGSLGGGWRAHDGFPSETVLEIWWPGALPNGIWQVEASWPGQTVYGQFEANTRILPEISLYDPRAGSEILPNFDGTPYACHRAASRDSYRIVAENFMPGSLVYLLIYDGDLEARLYFKTAFIADASGAAVLDLPLVFQPGSKYHIVGVPENVSTLTMNDGVEADRFAFSLIANAMDCFVVP
jgi:hypothetical protein